MFSWLFHSRHSKNLLNAMKTFLAFIVSKQKSFCTLFYGATTPAGLHNACLQDLLLGLSRSCSNTNCDVTISQNGESDNGTELMSDKCSERRLSMIIPRSLSATAVCNVRLSYHLTLSERWKSQHMSRPTLGKV